MLELAASYGLPGWAVLIIGAGTIVAALIAFLEAVIVAGITARSARRLALDTAHRERREEIAAPLLKRVRARADVAWDASKYSGSDARQPVQEFVSDLLARHDAVQVTSAVYLPTDNVIRVWGHWTRTVGDFRATCEAVTMQGNDPGSIAAGKIAVAGKNMLRAAAMMEAALDAYVYEPGFFARWRLRYELHRDISRPTPSHPADV
jgi:hypothetical protein